MREVTLEDMLAARENRVTVQQALLLAHQKPIVCFTLNIAGPVKHSPLIERAFLLGLERLKACLPPPLAEQTTIADTGCEAFLVFDQPANKLKSVCTAIEEETPLGRLFDMDVLDVNGFKLERQTPRSCIVCGAPGRVCSAGRLHSVEELQQATRTILLSSFLEIDADRVAALAEESLLQEVETTPKPGLVDFNNNGSHTDMTVDTFKNSARALKPFFAQCFTTGHKTAALPYCEAFSVLRDIGKAAEQAMYTATNGVNTHKGAIFTFGVLCGTLGRLWNGEMPVNNIAAILAECGALTETATNDLKTGNTDTAGLRYYHSHGITGIRGEVSAGFPSVATYGLPSLENALKHGLSTNEAGCVTLLHFIAHVHDTALYHRGGAEGALFAAEYARSLLSESSFPSRRRLEEMDQAFISRHLSPGGCADLLAITYFLHKLKESVTGR